MSGPRHLWSGDWREESAAAAAELARRRGAPAPASDPSPLPHPRQAEPRRAPREPRPLPHPRETEPRPVPGPPRAEPRWRTPEARAARAARAAQAARAARSARARLASVDRRRLRRVLPVLLLTLASAAIAYGIVSLIVSSDGPSAAAVNAPRGWIGVEMTGSPAGNGALVVSVVPGGPAAAAGLQPGDTITEIDNRAVSTPDGVTSALADLRAGDRVSLQVQRGLLQYQTQTTLAARPAGSP